MLKHVSKEHISTRTAALVRSTSQTGATPAHVRSQHSQSRSAANGLYNVQFFAWQGCERTRIESVDGVGPQRRYVRSCD